MFLRPQILKKPRVNQQQVQRVRVIRGCETDGRYDQPGRHR